MTKQKNRNLSGAPATNKLDGAGSPAKTPNLALEVFIAEGERYVDNVRASERRPGPGEGIDALTRMARKALSVRLKELEEAVAKGIPLQRRLMETRKLLASLEEMCPTQH